MIDNRYPSFNFVPNQQADYRYDFEKIMSDLRQYAETDVNKFLQFARFWTQESLFFLLYFVLKTPVNHPWLVDRINEVETCNDRTLDLWAREHYKALAIDTKVFTSNGWKCHGDLQPGDQIFGSDGQLIKVIANTGPMTGSKCYQIMFDDATIVAGADHLWPLQHKVRTRITGTNRRSIHYTTELTRTDKLPVTGNDWNYKMPRTPILECVREYGFMPLLPLDPYILGMWLGDDNSDRGVITTADEQVLDFIKMAGFTVAKQPGSDYGYIIGELKIILRNIGVLNNKHIPWKYLVASPQDRLSLLQGLMDSDGYCGESGTAHFTNTNHNLATGAFHLAASLDMKPQLYMPPSQNTGQYKPTYQVVFQAYSSRPPFRLTRKAERCKPGTLFNNGRYISSVDEIDSVPVNCIQVDAPDGIYLAGLELVPTHNSTIITYGLNIQEILNDPNTRIGIASHTRSIAKAFLRRIKFTLEENEFLKRLFPDILYENPASQSPKWSEDEGLVVKRPSVFQESTVEAFGLVDSQPTSKHYSILNFDDIVTIGSVSTPEQIRKLDECFRLSLNLGTAEGKRRIIGTTYHFADQYEKLKAQGGWIVRIHPCINDSGRPVLVSEDRLAELRRELGPYVFSCQQLLNPVAKKDQRFHYEWLRWYRELPDLLSLYLLCDPANEKKRKSVNSDYTVYWVWGLDQNGNKFLVDVVRDRFTLPERWKALKSLVLKHPGIQRIGYEQYGLAADIQHFEEMMANEGFYFNIIELGGNKLSKEDRIARLIPAFEQRKVYLPEHLYYTDKDGDELDLVRVFVDDEYLRFPFSQHDDMLDAASRIEDKILDASRPYDGGDWDYEGVVSHDIDGFFHRPGQQTPEGRSDWTGY